MYLTFAFVVDVQFLSCLLIVKVVETLFNSFGDTFFAVIVHLVALVSVAVGNTIDMNMFRPWSPSVRPFGETRKVCSDYQPYVTQLATCFLHQFMTHNAILWQFYCHCTWNCNWNVAA